MTYKLVIIIQKAFKLCCIYAIGRFKETRKQEIEWDTGFYSVLMMLIYLVKAYRL